MRPNIVFILMDDLGWRDLGCYGSTFYETPNLDRLAKQGMVFTDAYAASPVCSPTRASLLTGKYPVRTGITNFIRGGGAGKLIEAPNVFELSRDEVTIAKALKSAGYRTWLVGKWHLGDRPSYPEDHGFEVNIGGCHWGASKTYWSPWGIPTLPDGPPGEHLTDRLTDEAIKLIKSDDPDGRPFFLSLWHYAPHIPIEAPPELVEKYERKAGELGLDKIDALVPGEPMPKIQHRGQRVMRRVIQSDPKYAAMIEHIDSNIGRLLAALEASGKADNTIVVFTSDNGGLATAEGSPTTNRPLNEGKGWMYEGGTREPLIVRWPGVVEPGSRCEIPLTSPDFHPTFLEMAGATPMPEQHVDGTSFVPLLKGAKQWDRPPLFWHYPHYGNQGGTPGSSMREGDWKLIEFHEDGRLELYNLREDTGEARNRAVDFPDRAKAMHEKLKAWLQTVPAKYPTPNPEYQPTEPLIP